MKAGRWAVGAALLAFAGCTPLTFRTEYVPSPVGGDYADALRQATRTAKVYESEETLSLSTVVLAHATLLDTPMREALSKELRPRTGGTALAAIFYEEPKEQDMAFVVSMGSSKVDWQRIGNGQMWSVHLGDVTGPTPARVVKLRNPDRLEPFFPYIHPWSSDYLLLFDSAAAKPDPAKPVELHFLSPLGAFVLRWDRP